MHKNTDFDSSSFLTFSIRPFFEEKFGDILRCIKKEDTITYLEQNPLEVCSRLKCYFSAQLEFLEKIADLNCTKHIVELIESNFLLDIKTIPKKKTPILDNNQELQEETKNEEVLNFKTFIMGYLERISVYKYQILFRMLILYFHLQKPLSEQKNDDQKDNAEKKDKENKLKILKKDFSKDIVKLINLIRIKLDSEEDQSYQSFFQEIVKIFSLNQNNALLLVYLKEIFENYELPDIIESLEEKIAEINKVQETQAVLVEQIPATKSEPEQKLQLPEKTKALPNEREDKPIERFKSRKSDTLTSVSNQSTTQTIKTPTSNSSLLSAVPLRAEKSMPVNIKEKGEPVAAPRLIKTISQMSAVSQFSQFSQSTVSNQTQNQEPRKYSEDELSLKLTEKSKLLNQRMHHRSFYSSFAKTTKVVSKKKQKNKETFLDRFPDNTGSKKKKTKLTPAAAAIPARENSISFEKIFPAQGVKAEVPYNNNRAGQQQSDNMLQVPVLPAQIHEWTFDDVLAVNTPIKEGLSEASMNFSSCSNSRRFLEY